MAGSDPAALAASTAQGWAYTLNTVARPAPEHLEAAQEALNALDRATGGPTLSTPWHGVRVALSEALDAAAARLRVDGGRPEITVDQLVEALDKLREHTISVEPPKPDPALVQAIRDDSSADRIAALEAELEKAIERKNEERQARLIAETDRRRQTELRDRFEQERNQAQRALKAALAGRSAAIAAARDDSRRAGYQWTLAQLGLNLPGYSDMSSEELRDAASKRLGEVLLEAGQLRHVAKELVRIGRALMLGLDASPMILDQEEPVQLASAVLRLADQAAADIGTSWSRQRELEGELAELASEGAPELAAVRAERDMLTLARDAQAQELRELRAELTEARDELDAVTSNLVAANRRTPELRQRAEAAEAARWTALALADTARQAKDSAEQELAELRRVAAEGAVREEAARRRIAELEETLEADRKFDAEQPPR